LPSGLRGSIHQNQLEIPFDARDSRNYPSLESFCNDQLGLFVGENVSCRILDIDKQRFSLHLTMLADSLDRVRELVVGNLNDPYWKEPSLAKKSKSNRSGPKLQLRRITHPRFKNVTREEAEKHLTEDGMVGEVLFRPSSRGLNALSITWMVQKNKFENFAFEELDKKKNDPEIGKKLRIKNLDFADLEDIIINYITPMNNFIQTVLKFRKFKDKTYDEIKVINEKEKLAAPKGIPYYIIPYEKHPTAFVLAFRPSSRTYRAPVGISPDGYKLGGRVFNDIEGMIAWFKKNYQKIFANNNGSAGNRRNYRSSGVRPSYGRSRGYDTGASARYGDYRQDYRSGRSY